VVGAEGIEPPTLSV